MDTGKRGAKDTYEKKERTNVARQKHGDPRSQSEKGGEDPQLSGGRKKRIIHERLARRDYAREKKKGSFNGGSSPGGRSEDKMKKGKLSRKERKKTREQDSL